MPSQVTAVSWLVADSTGMMPSQVTGDRGQLASRRLDRHDA